ncbi:MAG: hypothetical protein JST82_06040 [Bacteroidetes bacterium]|nr:hypothetical protein [Bacteroidota bacterium]
MRKILFLVFLLLSLTQWCATAQDTIIYNTADKNISIGNKVFILNDTNSVLSIDEVIKSGKFIKSTQEVPNLEITKSTIWVRFTVSNATQNDDVVVELAYPTIDSVSFVSMNADNSYDVINTGEYIPYYKRAYKHQNYIFDLRLAPGESRTYYLRLNASEQLQVPLEVGTAKTILESTTSKDLIFGVYAGTILVMLFYNLFIFISVRDKNYLYYVAYILFVGMTQACVQGYGPRFLYPDSPYLANLMMVLMPVMVGVSALEFLRVFLQLKEYLPKLNKGIYVVEFFYLCIATLGFLGKYREAAQTVLGNAMLGSVYVVIIGSILSSRGNRTAKFFLLAWVIFLASVVVFVLRNFGVLPYNNFTLYALQIGSALEVVLLSFALADKISILRKEKEESQAQTLAAVQENARIVREQNVILEAKVAERTQELKESNDGLSKALVDLKEAEMQLVESEKMASLGQLTAGIAHEINNPINFVTSNVKPLKRDVDMMIQLLDQIEGISLSDDSAADKKKQIDELKEEYDFDYLKTEIDYLLNGINEGSSRTAEIVKGLRIFSRLDEDDLKRADLNEGLDSTLVIVNNQLDNRIEIVKNYGEIPPVECYPGKLNQVFLNIITNGLHAIKSKFKDEKGGKLTITTTSTDTHVIVGIADNGTGMDENTKKKLFEPFFTTKDVGEGTGLGLSIAYNTMVKHNGTINVNSTLGEGTEFIMEIPIVHEQKIA